MAYPPSYERDYSFTEFESLNPGQPKPGAALDTEFDDVSVALTATQDALALIQRDDGALANDSVGEDQLQDDVFDGIVDGITADAEAAAAAAAASATNAADAAIAADASADIASTQAGLAAGSAALAGSSQTIAQDAANEAALSASDAETSANDAELAANETAGSVAETQAAVDLAYKWAEYLAGPVMPAPGGYPEAVDDGMWSSKWWALRARDYSGFTPVDFGSGAGDIGDAYDAWIALGNELPPGNILAEWNGITYWLIDSDNPSDPASWIRITGDQGPPGVDGTDGIDGAPGPANSLAIGTVTTLPPGSPATATITGTPPAQTLSLGIPQGATGSGGTGAGGTPTALVGLTAVPGVASTLIRSDGAPAINQAIAPTWTEKHIFSKARVLVGEWALQLRSSAPSLQFTNTSGAVDSKSWAFNATPTNFTAYVHNDAESAAANWLSAARVANTIASVSFGNTADNPVFNFLGTGAATFGGKVIYTYVGASANATDHAIVINSAMPTLGFYETDAPTDQKGWQFLINGGAFLMRGPNDAGSAATNIFVINRTGGVIDNMTFYTQPIFTRAATSAGSPSVLISSSRASLAFNETDAAVDNRYWLRDVNGGELNEYVVNDAGSGASAWLTVTRTGAVINAVTFPPPVIFERVPTFAAGNGGTINLNCGLPAIVLDETDMATDGRRWAIYSSAGEFRICTLADASGSGVDFIKASRTGITVNAVTVAAPLWIGGAGAANGQLNFNSGIAGFIDSVNRSAGDLGFRWFVGANGGKNYMTLTSAGVLAIAASMQATSYVCSADTSKLYGFNPGLAYGGHYIQGALGSYTGLVIYDASVNMTAMSNGTAAGLYCQGDAAWLIFRQNGTQATISYNLTALSFNASSSRKIKRETGKPTRAADILSRLRPILYRLLKDDTNEQLGMIAEEVHDVCPQLSNGKTISYDRLAVLLLADWQESHGITAN